MSEKADIKQIIFASVYKPELVIKGATQKTVIEDTLATEVEVLNNADKCLIFDDPIEQPLTWQHMLNWYGKVTKIPEQLLNGNLFHRLLISLGSGAEQALFNTYYSNFSKILGYNVPALLPQVWMHYDPIDHRNALERQRADFLMLLNPDKSIIEVDGVHHYSEQQLLTLDYQDVFINEAIPAKYAAMVEGDRELMLKGYDVYRFGGADFFPDYYEPRVVDFFAKLLKKNGLL